jgi:ribonuclease HI
VSLSLDEFIAQINGQKITLYVDGACSGNPGPGGWGALLRVGTHECELSGFEARTTNNRMELLAAIESLQALPEKAHVVAYTDSQYVKNGITQWIMKWKKNNWQTANRQSVKNQDLWLALDNLLHRYHIEWHWVKAHAGHPFNERADALARGAIIAARMSL